MDIEKNFENQKKFKPTEIKITRGGRVSINLVACVPPSCVRQDAIGEDKSQRNKNNLFLFV